MKYLKRIFLKVIFLLLLIFSLVFIYSSSGKLPENSLVIGSKRFTESYILGEILKQSGEKAGETSIQYRQGLGNTGIVFAALQEGLIDIYPEYTGTIAIEILKRNDLSSAKPEELNRVLSSLQLGVSPSLGFQDNYTLAMLEENANALGIQNISDLKKYPQLIFGFSPEFIGREDGWKGVKKRYSLPQNQIKIIDHSLSYEALQRNKIQLIDIYSTDPKIEKYQLRVLEDDAHFFPIYEGVLLYRLESARKFPKSWKAFYDSLVDQISTKKMISLNSEAELKGKDFSQIATEFLQNTTTDKKRSSIQIFSERLFGPDLWRLTKEHLLLVFGALMPAICIGVILGIIAVYSPLSRHFIFNIIGAVQTIPSLALLAFLIPVFKEIGTLPALVALFLYSLLPIVRNTYAGLTNIPLSMKDSSIALGLPLFYRLYRIEIPLASRSILAGIKTAAVYNVGMATIAALIGAGGYGERIITGLALNDYPTLLSGAIPACVLAIVVQLSFDLLDYSLIDHTK